MNAKCHIPNCNADNAYHKTLHGGLNIPYMLKMHKNVVLYIQLIDLYAPCLVSKHAWNNEANMAAYCGSNDCFLERIVLSISDKAFLLVMLHNYSARWQA
jgi:hypothetical protein